MTITQAITAVDDVKPNQYTDAQKKSWLSELDGRIKREAIDKCEGADDVFFSGYDSGTDGGQELMLPAPWERIYVDWLCSQIDYYNGETGRYNNSVTVFNDNMDAFRAWYIQAHTPLQTAQFNY